MKSFQDRPLESPGYASLSPILRQFELFVLGTLGLNENHPLWFSHLTEGARRPVPCQRRGEQLFRWLGACGQVTGGGGRSLLGPAPTALSSTGSDVGPDGK